MKRLLLATTALMIFGACSQTYLEVDRTSDEICVYDRTFNFGGDLEKEVLIVCGPKETGK